MTDQLSHREQIECRLVIIDPYSMRVLTTNTAAGSLLPRESVPAYTRVAEALNEAIERRYGFRTIQLAILPQAEGQTYCAVHEILGSPEELPRSHSFGALDQIASSELVAAERSHVLKIMNGEANELGRFARLGWTEELLVKTGNYRGESSRPLIRQLNQGIDFCVLSLRDSTGRKMWFKAVGEPNTHEYALTLELTRRFPAYLPRILAAVPDWNGWVMEHVEGKPLNESDGLAQCEEALTALAIMQAEMVSDIASLSAIGAKDWSCARIASTLEPFFAEASCAMLAQTSTKSKPLARGELHQLKRDIGSALREFMEPGMPNTLVHGDIGHGNVITTTSGPVFLDWAETYIGHPFLCAEQLLADLGRCNPAFAERSDVLRTHYAAHWKPHIQPAELKLITALAPAIAAFAYAVIAWDVNRIRPDRSWVWPLLRSMLRRTKRELEKAQEFVA